jgi:O-antigen/teichoic acid export membrane protein
LGISAVVLSVTILRRGKLYHRLRPEARPRRWILISLLFLFAVFAISFPVWMAWPNALISRLLLGLFGLTFFLVGMTIKWLTPLVDSCIKRRGWSLR